MSRQRMRGGARLKALIWTVILVSAMYAGYKLVPVYFDNYQLQDKMQEIARFAVVNNMSEEKIRDAIFREIQERGIPARREDIRVSMSPRGINISLSYTVNVDLIVLQREIQFSPAVENRSL